MSRCCEARLLVKVESSLLRRRLVGGSVTSEAKGHIRALYVNQEESLCLFARNEVTNG